MRNKSLSLTMTASLILASTVEAATHRVPESFPKIQLAITAAAPGDSVLVGPGFYDENLHTQGKFLTLMGSGGADATIVDGGFRDRVLLLDGGGVVDGFTFQNGQAQHGGGVFIGDTNTPVVLRGNIIRNNIAGFVFDSGVGGGVYVDVSLAARTITQNLIEDNFAGDSGGGIYDGDLFEVHIIQDNDILRNRCHVGGGGADLCGPTFERNLVYGNHSDSFGGGVFGYGTIRFNTVVANSHSNSAVASGAGMTVTGLISHNVVANNFGPTGRQTGVGIMCRQETTLTCNVSWGNDGLDFAGSCDSTGARNVSMDPLFCNAAALDFSLSPESPCAPVAPSGCGLIGARNVNPACGLTLTRTTSWGMIKTIFR